MKQNFTFLLLLIFISSCQKKTIPPKVEPTYVQHVENFLLQIQKGQPKAIAALARYPFPRDTPMKDLESEQEFISNYDFIFDDQIIQELINSDPKADWGQVGAKGIMYKYGAVWLTTEGQLLGVNYEPAALKQRKLDLVSADKKELHESLSEYEKPKILIETEKYIVRIDELATGDLRYASWKIPSTMTDAPELVLLNGEYEYQGSGGDVHYIFKNGVYKYVVATNYLGPNNSPDAYLWVYNKEKKILDHGAKIIKK